MSLIDKILEKIEKIKLKYPEQKSICMNQLNKIDIVKEIKSDKLMLRQSVENLFKKINQNKTKKEIMLDFEKSKSITNSFAHEYICQKQKSKKEIKEINVPYNIQKMLDIISENQTKIKKTTINKIPSFC